MSYKNKKSPIQTISVEKSCFAKNNRFLPKYFKEQLKFQLSIDQDFYDKPTDELLNISDCNELYATVMEDKYWLQVWSDLLFLILVDVVHD